MKFLLCEKTCIVCAVVPFAQLISNRGTTSRPQKGEYARPVSVPSRMIQLSFNRVTYLGSLQITFRGPIKEEESATVVINL